MVKLVLYCFTGLFYVQHVLDQKNNQFQYDQKRAFYFQVFSLFFMPVQLFYSTIMLLSDFKIRDKSIFLGVTMAVAIVTFIPSAMALTIYNQYDIMNVLIYSTLFFPFYLATVLIIKEKVGNIYIIVNIYFQIFLILPYYFYMLHTSDLSDNIQYIPFLLFAQVLFYSGIILIVIIIMFNLLKTLYNDIRATSKEELFQLFKMFSPLSFIKQNMLKIGLILNSLGFTVNLWILCFTFYFRFKDKYQAEIQKHNFYNDGEVKYHNNEYLTHIEAGIINGLMYIMCFLFFNALVVLLLNIIPSEKPVTEKINLSEQLTSILQTKDVRYYILDLQNRVRRVITVNQLFYYQIILILLIIINYFFIHDDTHFYSYITIMIGLVISTVIFRFTFYLKQRLGEYKKALFPTIICLLWFLLYLPINIILCSTFYLDNQDEDSIFYQRIIQAIIILIFMCGIVIVGMLIHILYRKQEFERKFLFISNKTIVNLSKTAVKSDYHTLNLIYLEFIELGAKRLKQQMLNRKPVYWLQISKFNPDKRFSKLIVDQETFELINNKKKKGYSKIRRVVEVIMVYFYCYWNYEKQDMNEKGNDIADLVGDDKFDESDQLNLALEQAYQRQLEKEEADLKMDANVTPLKEYLMQIEKTKIPRDIIVPLQRYDMGQNVNISMDQGKENYIQINPFSDPRPQPYCIGEDRINNFLNFIFSLFAQGQNSRFKQSHLDYMCFKQLIQLSEIPIPDYQVDLIYMKFTSVNHQLNKRFISKKNFQELIHIVSKKVFKNDYQPVTVAVGQLCKMYLYPYLLWYLSPMHVYYIHEWEYVLWLLKTNSTKAEDIITEHVQKDDICRVILQKGLGIPFDSATVVKKEKKPSCMEVFSKWISKKCKEYYYNMIYFIKSHMLLHNEIYNVQDEIYQEFENIKVNILEAEGLSNTRHKAIKKDESPEWEIIVDNTISDLEKMENKYSDKQTSFSQHVRNTSLNYITFVLRVLEILCLGSLAFIEQISYGFNQVYINYLNGSSWDYKILVYFSILISLFFLFLAYKSTIRVKNQVYGNSEGKNKKRKRCSCDYLMIIILQFISFPLFIVIIRACMSAIVCDTSVVPIVLYQSDITYCFTREHILDIVLTVLAFILCYPSLTYLFPNLQYQNKSIEVKYNPTFLVIHQNFKFLLAGIALIFIHTPYYHNILSLIILTLLGVLARSMKPCFIKANNIIDMGLYFISAWMHFSSYIKYQFNSILIAVVVLVTGITIILIMTIILYCLIKNKIIKYITQKKLELLERQETQLIIEEEDEEEEEYLPPDSLEYNIWRKLNEQRKEKQNLKRLKQDIPDRDEPIEDDQPEPPKKEIYNE